MKEASAGASGGGQGDTNTWVDGDSSLYNKQVAKDSQKSI